MSKIQYVVLITAVFLIGLYGCSDDPLGPEKFEGYYVTAHDNNGRNVSMGSSIVVAALVTNYLGNAIRYCRIDWEIIKGEATFSTAVILKNSTSNTGSDGRASIRVYPTQKGEIRIRATAYATGDYADFILTAVD